MSQSDLVVFDTSGWTPVGGPGRGCREWQNQHEDILTLEVIESPPDPPFEVRVTAQVRTFTREIARRGGLAMISADVIRCGHAFAVRTLLKARQAEGGMTFLGTVSAQFDQVFFAFKVQCHETGISGARETAVALELDIDPAPGLLKRLFTVKQEPWCADPYDATVDMPLLPCKADDARWDDDFPDHPLTRCRQQLARLALSLRFDESLLQSED